MSAIVIGINELHCVTTKSQGVPSAQSEPYSMIARNLIISFLLASVSLALINFYSPLDLFLEHLSIDKPFGGAVGWADSKDFRMIAAAHLGVFVTLFALAPAVVSIVAERSNKYLQVPIFGRVVFDIVKPLNSSLLAAVGVSFSLGSLMLPSAILTILMGATLVILIALIFWQIWLSVNIQFETTKEITQRIVKYVEQELNEASFQEETSKKEIDQLRETLARNLGASPLYLPLNRSHFTRYVIPLEIPEGERVDRLQGVLVVKELRMLISKIEHSMGLASGADGPDDRCRPSLPTEYGYLSYTPKSPVIYLDIPRGHEREKVKEWIRATSISLSSRVRFKPDKRAFLFDRFEETFQNLYETAAENSLADLEVHFRVFKGIFPPLRIEGGKHGKGS